jgi:S-adenosylmethionine:tRNA ribosyltransferase-isomerase
LAEYEAFGASMQDLHIGDFVSFIRPGDVVVFNDSKVIPARFNAAAPNGKIYELTMHTSVPNPALAAGSQSASAAQRDAGEGSYSVLDAGESSQTRAAGEACALAVEESNKPSTGSTFASLGLADSPARGESALRATQRDTVENSRSVFDTPRASFDTSEASHTPNPALAAGSQS